MPFTKLPNEIILLISNQLDFNDQSSLLRTNRHAANLLAHTLVNNVFNTRSEKYGLGLTISTTVYKNSSAVGSLISRGILEFVPALKILNNAIRLQSKEVVRALLDHGISPRTPTQPDDSKVESPLYVATREGRLEIVEMLLERADIDVNFLHLRDSALFVAASFGFNSILLALLADPRINVNLLSPRSGTPLHGAAYRGSPQTVRTLINDPRVDVNSRDWGEATPLGKAVASGNLETVKLLMEDPRVNVNLVDMEGRTPLLSAVKSNDLSIVQLFLTDPRVNVNLPDMFGATPLSWLIYPKGDESIVRALLRHPEVRLDAVNNIGETLLHQAVMSTEGILRLLLEDGRINVNWVDVMGRTPFYTAVEQRRNASDRAVRLLLDDPRVDVKRCNNQCLTPLYLARAKANQELIQLLLGHEKFEDKP